MHNNNNWCDNTRTEDKELEKFKKSQDLKIETEKIVAYSNYGGPMGVTGHTEYHTKKNLGWHLEKW